MEVVKRISATGWSLALFVQVSFDDDEMTIIRRCGLASYRIKTEDGSLLGRDHLSRNMRSAYRSQLGRIKNRWSAALVRTSGFVLIDTLLVFVGLIAKAVRGLVRLFFGRRRSLLTATRGITVRSRRIERIKEAELFILVSLAAIAKAIEYARLLDQEIVYSGPKLFAELDGLDFAGAGGEIDTEFEATSVLIDAWSKVSG